MEKLGRRLHKSGDVVGVMKTHNCSPFIGRIDRIHWDCDPVWVSLIDVDTGERQSVQLQYVIGRLDGTNVPPRLEPEPLPASKRHDDPPGIGVALAD